MPPSYPATPPTRFWRFVHFPPVTLVIGLVIVIAPTIPLSRYLNAASLAPALGRDGAVAAVTAIAVAVTIGCYRLFNRLVEHRPNLEFQTAGWARELGAGLVTGLALFSAVVAVIALAGGYRIVGWNGWAGLPVALAVGIGPGFIEETIARGLIFRLVEQWLGSWVALAVSAALFGAAHLGNAQATVLAGGAIAIEAGIMLAALYMLTRRLWAAIGLHAAWNFTQGGIYDIPVSGTASHGLVRHASQGPAWLTGGEFGAEASAPAVVICGLFGLALLAAAIKHDRVVPFLPRRRSPAETDQRAPH